MAAKRLERPRTEARKDVTSISIQCVRLAFGPTSEAHGFIVSETLTDKASYRLSDLPIIEKNVPLTASVHASKAFT